MPSMYQPNGVVRTITTATATLSDYEAGGTIIVNRAAGSTITLPAATGSGHKYTLLVAATQTGDLVIDAATNGGDFSGVAYLGNDSAGASCFYSGANDNEITLDGTTTGGIKGAIVEVWDTTANEWTASVRSEASGTEATPFGTAS